MSTRRGSEESSLYSSRLHAGDAGLIPWVPLTNFAGPPETILRQCRDAIEHSSSPGEHANPLAVSQVMTRLRYYDPELLKIFGGSQAMIESPLIQELQAKTRHEAIMTILETRFGAVPPEIAVALQVISESRRLQQLTRDAVVCADFDSFHQLIGS